MTQQPNEPQSHEMNKPASIEEQTRMEYSEEPPAENAPSTTDSSMMETRTPAWDEVAAMATQGSDPDPVTSPAIAPQDRGVPMPPQESSQLRNISSASEMEALDRRLQAIEKKLEGAVTQQQFNRLIVEVSSLRQSRTEIQNSTPMPSRLEILIQDIREIKPIISKLPQQSNSLVQIVKSLEQRVIGLERTIRNLEPTINNLRQNTEIQAHKNFPASNKEDLLILQQTMQNLLSEFQEKIKYDRSKERLISELHQEITAYNGDIRYSLLSPLFQKFIQIYDELTLLIQKMQPYDRQTVASFISFQETIEEILDDYEIRPFSAETDVYNAQEQEVFDSIETTDPSSHQRIAERVFKGFRDSKRIFSRERVKVFTYRKSS